MSNSGSRPTRSGYNSPFSNSASRNASAAANSSSDRPRTFMDQWVEPALPTPIPSFAEHGIERHGVVQNMAPLGTRPSSKILKAATKAEALDLGRRNASSRRAAASASTTPRVMTPEPAAPPSSTTRRRSMSSKIEDDEDLPQTPIAQSSPRRSVPPSLDLTQSEGSTGIFSALPSAQPPSRNATPRSTTSNGNMNFSSEYMVEENRIEVAKVVENAVQRALDDGKICTAYALRTLFDEHHLTNKFFVPMFLDVMQGTATDAQVSEFNGSIRDRKREGARNSTANFYFNGDGSDLPGTRAGRLRDFTPTPAPSQPAAVATAAAAAAAPTTATPPPTTTTTITAAASFALPTPTFLPPGFQPASRPYQSVYSTPANAPVLEETRVNSPSVSLSLSPQKEDDQRSSKKRKSLHSLLTKGNIHDRIPDISKYSRKQRTRSNSADAIFPDIPKPSRAGSISSSSSLSSVDEEIIGEDEASKTKHQGAVTGHATMNNTLLQDNAKVVRPVSDGTDTEISPQTSEAIPSSSRDPRFSLLTPEDIAWIDEACASARSKPRPKPTKAQKLALAQFESQGNLLGPEDIAWIDQAIVEAQATYKQTKAQKLMHAHINGQQPEPAMPPKKGKAKSAAKPKGKKATAAAAAAAAAAATASTIAPAPTPAADQEDESDISTPIGFAGSAPYKINDQAQTMKRKARDITNDFEVMESSTRDESSPLAMDPWAPLSALAEASQPASQSPLLNTSATAVNDAPLATSAPAVAPASASTRETRTKKKPRTRYNDAEEASSPASVPVTFPNLLPASGSASRAGTPSNLDRLGKNGKAKVGPGLRTKISPMKKRGGARSGGESPTNGAGILDDAHHDDECTACGGNGLLVLCDGCSKSIHLCCNDPPMTEDQLAESAEFNCRVCEMRNVPIGKDVGPGSFGQLQANLDRMNPKSFHLPQQIREAFEDVMTGDQGEYQPVIAPAAFPQKGKPISQEPPNYFAKTDKKGNAILCHRCGNPPAAPDKSVIQCGFCPLYWHLDCCPIPLAKEPSIAPGAKKWKCPAHVDDLLAAIPGPKFRKLKAVPVTKPAFDRGTKNFGVIEIENEPDDQESESFYEQMHYGKIYKLPETGIKLDFIAKVKQIKAADKPAQQNDKRQPALSTSSAPAPAPLEARSLTEQQAALNLMHLANSSRLDPTRILVDALIEEAPVAVMQMIANGDGQRIANGKVTKKDRKSLLALQALISARLEAISDDESDAETATIVSLKKSSKRSRNDFQEDVAEKDDLSTDSTSKKSKRASSATKISDDAQSLPAKSGTVRENHKNGKSLG